MSQPPHPRSRTLLSTNPNRHCCPAPLGRFALEARQQEHIVCTTTEVSLLTSWTWFPASNDEQNAHLLEIAESCVERASPYLTYSRIHL